MLQITTFPFLWLVFVHICYCVSALPVLPQPDPAPIQPFHPTPTPPTTTISAFPEQSDFATCPLDLSDELLHGISNACNRGSQLSHTRCCPVLAAWLYSAYASTALGRAGKLASNTPVDLPVLPEDSESCVDNLDKAMKGKGFELRKPNETCDVVYCYCNIRLHPLSCSEAFTVSKEGKLQGNKVVKLLEKDCLNTNNKNSHSSLAGCSKCLNRLYQLREVKSVNNTRRSDRKTKMHNRDCELMGLTWLLSKNRTTYIHTVSTVLRALMLSTDGSDPRSCSLASDGLPLAVDSAEIDEKSSSTRQSGVATSLVYVCATIIFTMCLL
ncbi:hypothetical protein ACHQM5_009728 [Ranunculus cassubicifolius]